MFAQCFDKLKVLFTVCYYWSALKLLHKSHFYCKIQYCWKKHFPWVAILFLLEEVTKQKSMVLFLWQEKREKFSRVNYRSHFLPADPACLLPTWHRHPILHHTRILIYITLIWFWFTSHPHLKQLDGQAAELFSVGMVTEQSLDYLHKWDGRLKFAFPKPVCDSRYLKNGGKKVSYLLQNCIWTCEKPK